MDEIEIDKKPVISIEKTIEICHQAMLANENKSLIIFGAYIAFVAFCGRELVGAKFGVSVLFLALLNVFVGLPVMMLIRGYRNWKGHFLRTIQRLLDENEISQMNRPTSFRTDLLQLERVNRLSIDNIILGISILLYVGLTIFAILQFNSLPWNG